MYVQFSTQKRSILPVGDITQVSSDDKADIAVLEEPEHLTLYHHGRRWKNKFRKVIGVVHTNYLEYVKREKVDILVHFS
jgi:digalactosyldiacylglycerol synthase